MPAAARLFDRSQFLPKYLTSESHLSRQFCSKWKSLRLSQNVTCWVPVKTSVTIKVDLISSATSV